VLTALLVAITGIGWATAMDRPVAETGPGLPPPVTTVSSPASIALADHLSAAGAVLYTAYWCPHCSEQKQLFGKEAASRLKVVECAPDGRNNQAELCRAKKLQGFPSWEINGSIESGVKPLSVLAERSGYKGALPSP
jgi:hypothetical protein